MKATFLGAMLGRPERRFGLRNTRTNTFVAGVVEPAFDSATRRRGLLGRDRLDEGAAIIIAPTSAIHTFFMRFAIDVIFASRDGLVLKVYRALPPWRIAYRFGAFAAIELTADALGESDVRPGDRLDLGERTCVPKAESKSG